jgi:hypothetical protein
VRVHLVTAVRDRSKTDLTMFFIKAPKACFGSELVAANRPPPLADPAAAA